MGEDISKPRIAFLESVKNMKATNNEEIVNNVSFSFKDLFGVFNSDKQNGQTKTTRSFSICSILDSKTEVL